MRIGRLVVACVLTATSYTVAEGQMAVPTTGQISETPAPLDQPLEPGPLSACRVVDTAKTGGQADLLLVCPTKFGRRIGHADSYQMGFHAVSGSLLVVRQIDGRPQVQLFSVTPDNKLHVDDLAYEISRLSGGSQGRAVAGTTIDLTELATTGAIAVGVVGTKDRPAVAAKMLDLKSYAAAAAIASPPLVDFTPAPPVVADRLDGKR